MEEPQTQLCTICGITNGEQEFQQERASTELRQLTASWKKRNDPNEAAPGLPVTHEYRVHYALWLYQKYSSEELPILAIGRVVKEAEADYNAVVRALNYSSKA